MAWKRTGKCNRCGVCCLISYKILKIDIKDDNERMDKIREGWKVIRMTKTFVFLAKWNPCPYLGFDFKCELHGTKKQPLICKDFPIGNAYNFYRCVKHKCSIKLRRVRK